MESDMERDPCSSASRIISITLTQRIPVAERQRSHLESTINRPKTWFEFVNPYNRTFIIEPVHLEKVQKKSISRSRPAFRVHLSRTRVRISVDGPASGLRAGPGRYLCRLKSALYSSASRRYAHQRRPLKHLCENWQASQTPSSSAVPVTVPVPSQNDECKERTC